MNAKDQNSICIAEAAQQGQPVVGNNDPVPGFVASGNQIDNVPAVFPPAHGRLSKLLEAMYYWVHSRS